MFFTSSKTCWYNQTKPSNISSSTVSANLPQIIADKHIWPCIIIVLVLILQGQKKKRNGVGLRLRFLTKSCKVIYGWSREGHWNPKYDTTEMEQLIQRPSASKIAPAAWSIPCQLFPLLRKIQNKPNCAKSLDLQESIFEIDCTKCQNAPIHLKIYDETRGFKM